MLALAHCSRAHRRLSDGHLICSSLKCHRQVSLSCSHRRYAAWHVLSVRFWCRNQKFYTFLINMHLSHSYELITHFPFFFGLKLGQKIWFCKSVFLHKFIATFAVQQVRKREFLALISGFYVFFFKASRFTHFSLASIRRRPRQASSVASRQLQPISTFRQHKTKSGKFSRFRGQRIAQRIQAAQRAAILPLSAALADFSVRRRIIIPHRTIEILYCTN